MTIFAHKRGVSHSPGLAPLAAPSAEDAAASPPDLSLGLSLTQMPSSGFVEKSSLYSCLARNRLHETPSTLAFYLERTPRNVESWDASFRFDTLLWVDPYVRTAR